MGALFGIFTAVFWLVLFIDCLRNRFLGRGSKFGWVLALLFGNWIGMILYFIFACTFSPIATRIRGASNKYTTWQPVPPYQSQQPHRSYQPLPSMPYTPPAYPTYEQGYRAQEHAQTSQAAELPTEMSVYESQYEQPQVTYPEMPPQEQW